MTLEFKPTIKSINIANEDLTKITLEVKNDSLNGKYDTLRKLSGKTVMIAVIPETYSYVQEYDTSTKKPITEWIVNADGTAEIRKTEQTQLDIDGQGNLDIKRVDKKVDKDLIDQYILAASTLMLPDDVSINPRDVISRLQDGEGLSDIADDYEMSDAKLLHELDKARQHFAPFADYWDKHKSDIVFQPVDDEQEEETSESSDEEENGTEDEIEDENESGENENEIDDSDTDNAENDTETDENDTTETDDDDEPY
ncbi:hypothetical protein IV487_01845 [Enterococcus saccharolyticus]|uniref:hypothetical protein n=1 Tax=Enterococcus saccharolyticus TaxID=41997 RepID=UPI001E321EE5|nr:hypothetical protein [Enterococcus saccharolyticus]MCD5001206.1 hypothetical protein [Enterococcus saccharolyticus]